MATKRARRVRLAIMGALALLALLVYGAHRLWQRCDGMILSETRRVAKPTDEVILARALGHYDPQQAPIQGVYFRAVPLILLGIGPGPAEGWLTGYKLVLDLGHEEQPRLPWQLDPFVSRDTEDLVLRELWRTDLATQDTEDSLSLALDQPAIGPRFQVYERQVTQTITTRVLVDRGSETTQSAVYVFTTPYLHPNPWFLKDEYVERLRAELAGNEGGEAAVPFR